jgi:hypothetical protein
MSENPEVTMYSESRIVIMGPDIHRELSIEEWVKWETAYYEFWGKAKGGSYEAIASRDHTIQNLQSVISGLREAHKNEIDELWNGACLKHAAIGEFCTPSEHPCANCYVNNSR